MAFPNTPLDLLVEFQLDEIWVDVTADVFAPEAWGGGGVQIERGQRDQAGSIDPARAVFVLKDPDGTYSFRNPRSTYYGLLKKNTPVRVSVRPHITDTTTGLADLADTFTRTVAAGDSWGTADTGQTWTKSAGTAANKLSVSSGTGRLLVSTANTTVRAVLDEPSTYLDFDLYATFTTPVATGASLIPFILTMRRTPLDATDSGIFQVGTSTAGVVTLEVLGSNGSSLGTAVVSGLTHTGQALRVRVRFAGHTTQAKCWAASGSEPDDWHIVETDTVRTIFPPGSIAIACTAPTSNTNVPFTAQYDDIALTAIEPRVYAELSDLRPEWTPGAPTAGSVLARVEAAGVMRRLINVGGLPRSALGRYVLGNTTGLLAYWTLSDSSKSLTTSPVDLAARSIAGSGSTSWVGLVTGFSDGSDQSAKLGQGSFNAGWLENGVTFGADATGEQLLIDFTSVHYNGYAGWAVDWVRTGTKVSTSQIEAFSFSFTDGTAWKVTIDQATTAVIITDVNVATHSTSLAATTIFDGLPHTLRFQVLPDSATTLRYRFYLDGDELVNATMTPTNWAGAGQHYFWQLAQTDTAVGVTYGHVLLWDGTSPPSATAVSDAVQGYAGETTNERIGRILEEEGLNYRLRDASGDTSNDLGPQGIGTAWDAMKAAADADTGLLYELPDAPGLEYRLRTTMYSQARQIDLTYTTDGHLQPGLQPCEDLSGAANLVTVTRQFAGDFTAEITTGPMSTQLPPNGIGPYPRRLVLPLAEDDDAQDAADWYASLGTVDETRWPGIVLSLNHMFKHGLQSLVADVLRASMGHRITIGDLPDHLPPGEVDQHIAGYVETLSNFEWGLQLTTVPASPYAVAIWNGDPDPFAGRWDQTHSTLDAGVSSSATSLSVATSSGRLWTTSAGDFPFDINVAGVRITVTNITGGSSPQTFTVTRSVDGFDVALSAGARVSLWAPRRWGM